MKEFFVLPEGELEFQIAYDRDTKRRIGQLESEIRPMGYRPELTGTVDECVLAVRKSEPSAATGARLPVLLVLFALASLVVVSILQRMVYAQLAPALQGDSVFIEFAATIVALLAAHEVGQRLMARRGQAGHSNTYLIPGLPFLPPFLPSLGFVCTQREPALNRDRLFDVVIAGPIAIVVLAVVLYAVGDLTSATSALKSTQLPASTISVNSNVIQLGINYVLGPLAPSAPAGYFQVSPFADGATVGFILAFFGLLPMAIYDGGLLSNLALGERAARGATYLSVLFLLLIDMNNATYWAVAIVALLLAGRPMNLKLLDQVSALSSSRRWILVGSIILGLLCLPIPHSLATLPLP